MLIRSNWTLTVDRPMTLPRNYGLELVKILHKRINLEMGQEKIPTTTCTGLLGKCTTSQNFITFQPGEFYQLYLTGLEENRSKAIASLDLSPSLEFLGTTFNAIDRNNRISSYEALYHARVAAEPEPVREFQLEFLTPTAFSQQGIQLPLPVPTLMFRSWLERWNEFAPVYLGGQELVGYFDSAIALKRHKIHSQRYPLNQGYVNGFVGKVTLQVLARTDPLLANVAHLLLEYAQFSGTGMKTRLGMGCIDWVQAN
ncbi:CRISPR system precrRNA processing endoribonuclease RAMP protein Cas6 [Roseofilum sp. BLCC_M91]|uniref:CRISPR system precrRNA processing endoribonuclease RAMP protein Cas6 n=1 Tax=Roseofilum halophilum BLCC-M91 TaxID=3022259 RepID=A0ABT7BNE5_9CYAN|nr:CRISPR system precrRNA processing endoribonuclease RAMP protein Cas6 [Roseofilum halophilum]MDJ1180703.1 CRISPR system precrRNA processing endoribonuclease RAMP protein Cas6 [Roseofilum halophilum BLCC-M91]